MACLRDKYPAIDSVIEELVDTLIVSWNVPHRPIHSQDGDDVYGAALDYPPHGSAGTGALFATYHATAEAQNKMTHPLREYTLLTLAERKKGPPAGPARERDG